LHEAALEAAVGPAQPQLTIDPRIDGTVAAQPATRLAKERVEYGLGAAPTVD